MQHIIPIITIIAIALLATGCTGLRMEHTYNPGAETLIVSRGGLTDEAIADGHDINPMTQSIGGTARKDRSELAVCWTLADDQRVAVLLHEDRHILMRLAEDMGWSQAELNNLNLLLIESLRAYDGVGFDTGHDQHERF